jgi:hypothetical protein
MSVANVHQVRCVGALKMYLVVHGDFGVPNKCDYSVNTVFSLRILKKEKWEETVEE